MAKTSAGILMYRLRSGDLEILLVHPGGPFWAKKDDGAWSIPKGVYEEGENPLVAAKREFEEETGCFPDGHFIELGDFKQPSGKLISAWAVEGDFDLRKFKSNNFTMEWPPKSGITKEFPEADRADWFGPDEASRKILKGQAPILGTFFARLKVAPISSRKSEDSKSNRDDRNRPAQGSLFD